MQVPSNRRDCPRQRWRGSIAVVSMLAVMALGGAAQAASFDEKVKAPQIRTAGEFESQAEPFALKYRAMRESNPEQLIRDPAMSRQKFDLKWQLLRAVESRKPLGDLTALGLISQGDGSYRIDLAAYPEWDDLHETIAGMLSRANIDATGPALMARGFRPEDLVTLKNYIAKHDSDAAARAESAAITLDFANVVRKYDKLKRPVPDALIESFYYQRTRAYGENKRRWVEGLLEVLDAHRDRVLLSTFLEIKPTSTWMPSDLKAAGEELMAEIRKPDFEARVQAEAKGVAP
jgi:hypothetical protein